MKKGITIWAFPGGIIGRTSVEQAVIQAIESGFDGVELSLTKVGEISLPSKLADLRLLREKVRDTGGELLSLSTLLFHDYSITSNVEENSKVAFEIASKMLEIAALLNIPSVTINPGTVTAEDAYDDCFARSNEKVGSLVRRAEQLGVDLCVENVFNKFLLSPLEMKSYLEGFKSKYVGVCLDIGNTMLMSYPEHWIKILGSYIKKVHITDFLVHSHFHAEVADIGYGHVDWDNVLNYLRQIEFHGPMIAEVFCSRERPYIDNLNRVSQVMSWLERGMIDGQKINTHIKSTS
jgi:hexulose-6-phosphate isomerase